MNTGAFGENFPYSNFHDLNTDWIIQIVKDFLDKYSNIENLINTGLTDIDETTQQSLTELSNLATQLTTAFNSEAGQITSENIATLSAEIAQRAEDTIQSIPSDYTELYQTVLRVQDASNTLLQQVGDFQGSLLDKTYEHRVVCNYQAGTVLNDRDVYEPSNRALFPIPESFYDGNKVYVYNPYKHIIGVYYRNKSDGTYGGYTQTLTDTVFFSFTVNTSLYSYTMFARSADNNNWTNNDLAVLNQEVYVYSGEHIEFDDITGIIKDGNMIKPSNIHIGKYYSENGIDDNPQMAYTDLLPVKEYHTYYFPFVTLGYSWFDKDEILLSGGYTARESAEFPIPYITLQSPAGASYIGVSVRSGDVPNMVLSEIPNSEVVAEKASIIPSVKSKIVRENLNYLYNFDFKQNRSPSRLITLVSSGVIYDGTGAVFPQGNAMNCMDYIALYNSKMIFIFTVPSNQNPEFVCGMTNASSPGSGLSNPSGSIAVLFKSNGTQAEVRYGTGASGAFDNLITTLDISGISLRNGNKIACTIEKQTINKYIIEIYNAETPKTKVSYTYNATISGDSASGQIRGWGGPYFKCNTGGNVKLFTIKMFSTMPTYPTVAIWGDSYIEGFGRSPETCFQTYISDALDGDCFVSARGGSTTEQMKRQMGKELNCCAPKYIILATGVNDSTMVSENTYKTNVLEIIDMIKQKGAEPILMTVPAIITNDVNNTAWITNINPWIRSLGYRYIDAALAMCSTSETTPDPAKYMPDMTHPSSTGARAIFDSLAISIPDILWK